MIQLIAIILGLYLLIRFPIISILGLVIFIGVHIL